MDHSLDVRIRDYYIVNLGSHMMATAESIESDHGYVHSHGLDRHEPRSPQVDSTATFHRFDPPGAILFAQNFAYRFLITFRLLNPLDLQLVLGEKCVAGALETPFPALRLPRSTAWLF
jgi:hypothetical protein